MYILFTDTDCDMTPAEAKEYGYHLISMPYTIDGKEIKPYEDFKEFEGHKFYQKLRDGALPTTSAISPLDYKNYFEPFLKEGNDILYVHFSKAMSGTFNAMNIALEELKVTYPNNTVYTIDTKGITICSYNIVREIGRMYIDGKTLEEILKWSETEVDKFATYFYADNLKFFQRSGRIGNFKAIMGTLFGVHPIMYMDKNGVMMALDKAKGKNKTLEKLIDYVVDLGEDLEDHDIIIGHGDCLDIAKEVHERLEKRLGKKINVIYTYVNPTAGSHCGPDAMGISFHAKHR